LWTNPVVAEVTSSIRVLAKYNVWVLSYEIALKPNIWRLRAIYRSNGRGYFSQVLEGRVLTAGTSVLLRKDKAQNTCADVDVAIWYMLHVHTVTCISDYRRGLDW
jgi:hypothetical protein